MNISKLEALKLYSKSTYDNGLKIANAFKSIFNKVTSK